ncbi:MAG TPA: hypothetical protein VMW68_08315 [Methyloceanibacter sp.]|nr:hypothetical protein [Methyloceanibacter sp.]
MPQVSENQRQSFGQSVKPTMIGQITDSCTREALRDLKRSFYLNTRRGTGIGNPNGAGDHRDEKIDCSDDVEKLRPNIPSLKKPIYAKLSSKAPWTDAAYRRHHSGFHEQHK